MLLLKLKCDYIEKLKYLYVFDVSIRTFYFAIDIT